jgi:glutaminyl-peptide cyclotransferase
VDSARVPHYHRRAPRWTRRLCLGAGALALGLQLAACRASEDTGQPPPLVPVYEELGVRVEHMYPHARDAFTQGLVYEEGWLYESTGLEGSSTLRRTEVESGRVDQSVALPSDVFGEGLATLGARLVQLSWQSGRAFVWDRESLTLEHELGYTGEGWGLCYDGVRLIMSDGTHVLTLRDPETFERIGSLEVTRQRAPVERLNELECVGDYIYANVWQEQQIARIDAVSGEVTGWIDTGGLLSREGVGDVRGADVLNGIAYVPERDRFLITGKRWPWVFEVAWVNVR